MAGGAPGAVVGVVPVGAVAEAVGAAVAVVVGLAPVLGSWHTQRI